MGSTFALGSAITLVAAAGKVLKSTGSNAGKAYDKYQKIQEYGSAITSISRQTTILSRVFIDESIYDEPVLSNLMKSVHSWYCAQIITALQLTEMVNDKETVAGVMSLIDTGNSGALDRIIDSVHHRLTAQESFLGDTFKELCLESLNPSRFEPLKQSAKEETKVRESNRDKTVKDDSAVEIKSVKVGDSQIGPLGELYEIKLNNPKSPEHSIKVPVFIQMQPSLIPADYAARFIDLNVTPTLWQRWTQMTSGEISFFKDFVLNVDLIKRHQNIIKDPEASAAFSEYIRTVGKKDSYVMSDMYTKTAKHVSHNLANSVMIFSEDAVREAKVQSGVDLHKPHDRNRYFNDTYTMIIAIIDSMHQRVTIYFNGIDGELNRSYSDFRPSDKKFDPNDFMQALQTFSTGNIGRLR